VIEINQSINQSTDLPQGGSSVSRDAEEDGEHGDKESDQEDDSLGTDPG